MNIINDNQYNWLHHLNSDREILFKGIIWINDKYYVGIEACNRLYCIFKNCDNIVNIKQKFSNIAGHYSFILKTSSFIIASVDKIRSYPIFYYNNNQLFSISNSANLIRVDNNIDRIDNESLLFFKMAGYTLGRNTIYKNLFQLQAGEFCFYKKEINKVSIVSYFRYFKKSFKHISEEHLIDELHIATKSTFEKMVETLNDRPVLVPLSGGYDSRLILAFLKEYKYDNIVTFTYGMKGLWEIKRAKFIAEKLDVPWYYLNYNPKITRKYFNENDRKEYFKFGSGLTSVPSLSTYYSILELKKRMLLKDKAIIINGQSGDFTSGGHIPKILATFNSKNRISTNHLIDSIIEKHFSLWQNLKTSKNITLLNDKLKESIGFYEENISAELFAAYFEYHEWIERQSKFVVNGQRAYDWFGVEWRLPLWSDDLIEFWVKVPWNIKFQQKLLIKYLLRYNFQGIFDIKLPQRYSFFPFWAKPLKPILHIASDMTNRNIDYYYTKYLKFFMTYAPYYTQQSYWTYLKDSKYHRNVISYWMKQYLDETINK